MGIVRSTTPITPGRFTKFITHLNEYITARPKFVHTRLAKEFRVHRPKGAPITYNIIHDGLMCVMLAPGDADPSNMMKGKWGNFIGPDQWWGGGGFRERKMNRKRNDLIDSEPSDGLTTPEEVKSMQKIQPAGSSWNKSMPDSALVTPQPSDGANNSYPIDRVLDSKDIFAENQPWSIGLLLPNKWDQFDTIFRFYFGGPTPVSPKDMSGGRWCVSLQGNGEARLYEQQTKGGLAWDFRYSFIWTDPKMNGNVVYLVIIPHARDLMTFLPFNAGMYVDGGFTLLNLILSQASAILSMQQRHQMWTYQEISSVTQHEHLGFASGPGQLHVDLRRIDRFPFSIHRLQFPASGTFVDGGIRIPWPMPAGTPITINSRVYTPPGTNISVHLHGLKSNTACATNAKEQFLSIAGETDYYVEFVLSTTKDNLTPCLFGYTLEIDGLLRPLTLNIAKQFDVAKVSIAGPDLDPHHEYGHVSIHDLQNQAVVLRQHDRVRSSIEIWDVNGNIITRLMDCETLQPNALERGAHGDAYPPPYWTDYEGMRVMGLHTRLDEQVMLTLHSFGQDPAIKRSPTDWLFNPKVQPWKITDIIKEGLRQCGFPDDEIAIPDLPQRLWPVESGNKDQWIFPPGSNWGQLITKLALFYLALPLVRDPNAGPRGMWRLIPNPRTSGGNLNVLWRFWRDPPYTDGIPRNIMAPGYWNVPGSIGEIPHPVGTFIKHGTWRTTIKAPEINYVAVSAVGETLPTDNKGGSKNSVFLYNPISFDWDGVPARADPNHPDFVGHRIPGIISDASLGAANALGFTARRAMDFSGHAEKWAFFTAPLVLTWDPEDLYQFYTRPPRINDLCVVREGGTDYLATIRSCNPDYEHDDFQWAYYEIRFVNDWGF
jgi:hypothetical protein